MFGYQKSVKKTWFILNKIVNNTCPQLKTKKLWNSLKLYNWVKYFDREIKFVTFTRIKNIFAMLRFKVSTVYFLVFKVTAIDWNFANIRLNQGIIKLFYLNQFKFRLACWHSLTFWWECPPPLGLVCQEQQYHCQVCANSQQE